jgi:hypothetical protein
VFDDAFSARRAKVELRLFLDRVQRRPRKRWGSADLSEGLAAERRSVRLPREPKPLFALPLPSADEPRTPVAVFGSDPELAGFACEAVLHGRTVSAPAATDAFRSHFATALAEALRRGRVTPLEADQARARLDPAGTHLASARFAVADRSGFPALMAAEPALPPACAVAVPADLLPVAKATAYRPQRVTAGPPVAAACRPRAPGTPAAAA